MSEIRLITSSDEHLADLNPGFRKDNYRDAILAKLEWQGGLAKRFNADGFIRGGDFFHVKPANKTTMATMALAAKIHRGYPCPTWALPGNHDISNNDLDTVPRQPLGVMFESGVFRPLEDQVFESGSLKVRVVGVPYVVDLDDEALRDMVRKRPDDDVVIAVVHALSANAPEQRVQTFFNERIFDYRDLVFKGCPDAYVFAHYHKDQGIQEIHGTHFVNLGAIGRGSLTFENMDRQPKSSSILINSQGLSLEEHAIPVRDAAEVFDLEKKKQLDKERRDLNEFIQQLRADSTITVGDDVRKKLDALEAAELAEDVKRKVQETLEAAEAGLVDEL